MSLPPWSLAAAVAAGFALAMSLLLATRLDGDLAALAAPVCGVLAAILFLLPPALLKAFAPVRLLAVAAAGGMIAATATAAVHPAGTPALVGAAAGLWLLLLGSLGVLLARPCGGAAAALSWLALLAVNPLTHLGTPAGIDYHNVFSKAMAAYGEPEVTDTQGVAHNWRNDLAAKLISLQGADGSWVNKDSKRWWEGDPNLCTAWSVIALNLAVAK